MKINKVLIILSSVTLLPYIILFISSFITHQVLIPLDICQAFNGNDFGESLICNIFPTISYFGFILIMFGGLGLSKIFGIILISIYFIKIFLHNWRNSDQKWKYSKYMIALTSVLILISILSEYIYLTPEDKTQMSLNRVYVPTEYTFVCEGGVSLELDKNNQTSNISVTSLVVIDENIGALGYTFIGDILYEQDGYKWHLISEDYYANSDVFVEESIKYVRSCKNINGQTVSDLYGDITEQDFIN